MLGLTVRDVITGFQGIVTGHVNYITGCDQFLVTAPVVGGGSPPEPRWIDEQRLEIVESTPIVLPSERSARSRGADAPAPVK